VWRFIKSCCWQRSILHPAVWRCVLFYMTLCSPITADTMYCKGKGCPITSPKAQRESRGIALLIRDLGARRGWVVSTTPRPLYPGKDPVLLVQETGLAPGPVWTCAKNLFANGIWSPDRPARSQSLYRLSYPGTMYCTDLKIILYHMHNRRIT
jgi:hypothetical protein